MSFAEILYLIESCPIYIPEGKEISKIIFESGTVTMSSTSSTKDSLSFKRAAGPPFLDCAGGAAGCAEGVAAGLPFEGGEGGGDVRLSQSGFRPVS